MAPSGNNRIGARPAYQYLGPDDETTTLSGVLLPEVTGGPVSSTCSTIWLTAVRLFP